MSEQPKKRGGDTRLAAAKNGKTVGRTPRTGGKPMTVSVTIRLDPDLKTFVRKQPGGESEYIRSLISRAEIESRIF